MKYLILLLLITGCAHTQQKWTQKTEIPDLNMSIEDTKVVSKTSFMYWTRFNADSTIGDMEVSVYNAEARVDSDAIRTLTDLLSKIESILGIKFKVMGARLREIHPRTPEPGCITEVGAQHSET